MECVIFTFNTSTCITNDVGTCQNIQVDLHVIENMEFSLDRFI